LIGITEFGAQGHRAGARIHRLFGKAQLARLRIDRAIGQNQLHRQIGRLELAALHLLTQLQQIGSRLGEGHIDRIELFNGGQMGGVTLADQRAFGHQGTANATGNRRQHAGVGQIQLAAGHCSFIGGDIGLGLLERGFSLIKLLL